MPTLICDLDGVLFSDAPNRRIDAWRAANGDELDVTSEAELEDDELAAFRAGALGEGEYARHLRARLGWTGSDEDLVSGWSAGAAVALELIEVLAALRTDGWELIAADDADPWTWRARQEQFGWVLSMFNQVVRPGGIGARRPDPRFFAELLRELPRHGPRLYVDDDPRNVSAARRAGLDAQLYTGAAALRSGCRSVLLAST